MDLHKATYTLQIIIIWLYLIIILRIIRCKCKYLTDRIMCQTYFLLGLLLLSLLFLLFLLLSSLLLSVLLALLETLELFNFSLLAWPFWAFLEDPPPRPLTFHLNMMMVVIRSFFHTCKIHIMRLGFFSQMLALKFVGSHIPKLISG